MCVLRSYISMVQRIRDTQGGTLTEVSPPPPLLLRFYFPILSTPFTLNTFHSFPVYSSYNSYAQWNRYLYVLLYPFISYMKNNIQYSFVNGFFPTYIMEVI